METDQYTHRRVFNLSACPSTHRTNPCHPLETVCITHQVPYHNTKLIPILLYTNPTQTVIYLTLYIDSVPPNILNSPFPQTSLHLCWHSCLQTLPFLQTYPHSLRKLLNSHLCIGEKYKRRENYASARSLICFYVYILHVKMYIKLHHRNNILVIYEGRRAYFLYDGSQILLFPLLWFAQGPVPSFLRYKIH